MEAVACQKAALSAVGRAKLEESCLSYCGEKNLKPYFYLLYNLPVAT